MSMKFNRGYLLDYLLYSISVVVTSQILLGRGASWDWKQMAQLSFVGFLIYVVLGRFAHPLTLSGYQFGQGMQLGQQYISGLNQ